MPQHPPDTTRHYPPGHAQKHANSMQIGFRARLDPCFARQGSFIPHLGPLRTAPGHFRACFSIEQARLYPTWGPQRLPIGTPRNPRNLELRAPSRKKTIESGHKLATVTRKGFLAPSKRAPRHWRQPINFVLRAAPRSVFPKHAI